MTDSDKLTKAHETKKRSMLLSKLRKVKPRHGKDKLGIPDLLILVGVTGIQVRTLAGTSVRLGEKTNGNGPRLLGSPW